MEPRGGGVAQARLQGDARREQRHGDDDRGGDCERPASPTEPRDGDEQEGDPETGGECGRAQDTDVPGVVRGAHERPEHSVGVYRARPEGGGSLTERRRRERYERQQAAEHDPRIALGHVHRARL